jgi:hypothetical protein
MPILPWRRNLDNLSEAERNKRLIRQLIIKGVLIFMGGVAIIYIVIAAVVGAGIFVPKTASQVLGSVAPSTHYGWTSQTARKVILAGESVEQDSFRSVILDTQLNRFQALTVGTLPDKTAFSSDGHVTLFLTNADQQSATTWSLATNYCDHAPAVSAQLLTMPTAEEIKAAQPRIVTTQGTVYGQQAWVLSFHPTPTMFDHLLWISFFAQATQADPSNNNWVLSPEERTDFLNGHYHILQADAWVTHNSPRQLVQIYISVKTDGPDGSTWRILAQRDPNQTTKPVLTSLHIQAPDCSLIRTAEGNAGSSVPAPTTTAPTAATTATAAPSASTTTSTSATTTATTLATTSATTAPSRKRTSATKHPTKKNAVAAAKKKAKKPAKKPAKKQAKKTTKRTSTTG